MCNYSWNLIRSGDEEAFRALYEQHADLLYGYGMKIVKNDDIVTEAIQELFVYIYEKRKTISEPKYIISYLCVSLRRLLLRTVKKKRTHIVVSDEVSMAEYRFDLELDAESAMIDNEIRDELVVSLQSVFEKLAPQQREVVYLKYYSRLSNEEIAEVLGTTNQVVRNLASRALAKIKKCGDWTIRGLILVIYSYCLS